VLDLSGQEINNTGAEHLANVLQNNQVIIFTFSFVFNRMFIVTDTESIES
jgi:hypothetical protein